MKDVIVVCMVDVVLGKEALTVRTGLYRFQCRPHDRSWSAARPSICLSKQSSNGAWKQQIDPLPETSTLGHRCDCVVSSSCDVCLRMVNTVLTFAIIVSSFRLFLFVPVLLQVHTAAHPDYNSSQIGVIDA